MTKGLDNMKLSNNVNVQAALTSLNHCCRVAGRM